MGYATAPRRITRRSFAVVPAHTPSSESSPRA